MRAIGVMAAAVLLAGPALADTRAGVEAWQRGDYKTAVDQWRAAAANGDADAEFNLGQAYKLGRGVPVDIALAESWYGKAAAQGHLQAADGYGLALFQNGKVHDAIPYLEKSVQRGEPRAQYILGTMLFNGTDIPKDWVRSYALLTRAAAQGLPQANKSLEQMDQYIPAEQREQGVALARSMAADQPAATPPVEVAANDGDQARSVTVAPKAVAPPPREPVKAAPPAAVAAVPAPKPVGKPRPPVVATATTGGGWRLQLGAFGDPGNAHRLWDKLAGQFAGRSADFVKAGAITRVLVGPFGSRAEAVRSCGTVKPCVPVSR